MASLLYTEKSKKPGKIVEAETILFSLMNHEGEGRRMGSDWGMEKYHRTAIQKQQKCNLPLLLMMAYILAGQNVNLGTISAAESGKPTYPDGMHVEEKSISLK